MMRIFLPGLFARIDIMIENDKKNQLRPTPTSKEYLAGRIDALSDLKQYFLDYKDTLDE